MFAVSWEEAKLQTVEETRTLSINSAHNFSPQVHRQGNLLLLRCTHHCASDLIPILPDLLLMIEGKGDGSSGGEPRSKEHDESRSENWTNERKLCIFFITTQKRTTSSTLASKLRRAVGRAGVGDFGASGLWTSPPDWSRLVPLLSPSKHAMIFCYG